MTIRKGTHAPVRMPCVQLGPEMAHRVQFTPSCRYDIGPEQADINKLFGVGYIPSHHHNSVRFGWRYDIASGMIEILAYWYRNRVRQWSSLKFVAIGQWNNYVIRRLGNVHELWINNDRHIIDVPSQRIGFVLGPYFGGNMTAPHDITINIERI